MVVRPALADDVPAIAGVFVASWEGAYRGLMPDEIFDLVTYERRLVQWDRYFAEPRPDHPTWVAETESGDIAGVANVGPALDEDLDSETVGQLLAIYVAPEYWGLGYGRDLMVAALAGAVELGFGEVVLWVLDTNHRGRDFYAAGGWFADGASKVDESFGIPLREVRYRIRLDTSGD